MPDLGSMRKPYKRQLVGFRPMSKTLAWISIGIGGVATLVALVHASQFFFVARGAHLRPMGWAMQITFVAGCALVLGVPPGIYALFTPCRKLAAVGIGLSLLPYPLSIATVQIASAVCGFTLAR